MAGAGGGSVTWNKCDIFVGAGGGGKFKSFVRKELNFVSFEGQVQSFFAWLSTLVELCQFLSPRSIRRIKVQ